MNLYLAQLRRYSMKNWKYKNIYEINQVARGKRKLPYYHRIKSNDKVIENTDGVF